MYNIDLLVELYLFSIINQQTNNKWTGNNRVKRPLYLFLDSTSFFLYKISQPYPNIQKRNPPAFQEYKFQPSCSLEQFCHLYLIMTFQLSKCAHYQAY